MWVFNKLRVGDKLRNPIQGEFFATSAIDGPAQALVRESVQNSLDAKARSPVRVQITVATTELPPQDAIDNLFSGAWEHFGASDNGLQDPKPEPGTPCPYLIVEDFNTKGLSGDPAQTGPGPGDKNDFFNFFRAEGLSGKTGAELGRWGVGKFVFPRSSRASTHFGITVRESDRRRLMLGAVTLKGHHMDGEPDLFTPDGLHGVKREDGLVLPLEDPTEIDSVAGIFKIQRAHEPGTSVIVPFIDPDDFTFEALVNAAIRSYFTPLLAGRLELIVRHDGSEVALRQDTLVSVLESNDGLAQDLLPLVRLAQLASSAQDQHRIVLEMPDPAHAAKWSKKLVGEEALKKLRQTLVAREPLAIRVPLTVRSKARGDMPSYFDVYLCVDRDCSERPVFVREGIIISDVRGRRTREIRSLVVVEDGPLAEMLGNSENPAHTQWQKDGSKFKGYYTYGPAVIDFVTNSVSELLSILNQASQEPDPSLTIDFFSVEPVGDLQEAEDSAKNKSRKKHGNDTELPEPEIESRPQRIAIHHAASGFTVESGAAPPPVPFLLEIRCAYETRNGNPLKKWDAADFVLDDSRHSINLSGAVRVITQHGNCLVLRVDALDFRISVSGFDTSRDLYLRADVKEAGNADPEA